MKKLICLLLVVCILCPLLVGCGWQDDETRMKKAYLRKLKIKDKSPEDVIIEYDGGTYNGARIVMLDAGCHDSKEWTETVGDTTITYYDSNRILVYKFGKLYTLKEAKNRLILSKKQIQSIAEDFNGKVLHFRDTCDIYDFKEFEYWDNLELGSPYGKTPVSNMIGVDIDIRVCTNNTSNDFDVVNYLGSDIISKVDSIIKFDNLWTYFLRTTTDGLENIPIIIERLQNIPGVLGAGYYWKFYNPGASVSNNSYNSNQIGWGLCDINIENVWEFTVGSSSVNVGIVDSGINAHLDLENNLREGYNFVSNNYSTTDVYEHGTTVAGVIGANGNILGVNWNVGLVPYKVYPREHPKHGLDVYTNHIVSAINKAKESYLYSAYPLKILNISLGEILDTNQLKQAISEYSGLVVVCASNDNINTDEHHQYPGFYGSELYGEGRLDNIIVVGALNENGNRWYEVIDGNVYGSNYGSKTVDIYAPGTNIYTTTSTGGYEYKTGTSYAAPHVSGVAALLLSIQPNLTGAQLKECILSGADEITINVGINNTQTQTVKKLNAWGAFKYLMDNYYTYETNEIHNVGSNSDSIAFTDTITDTSSYSRFKENTSFIKLNLEETGDLSFNISSNKNFSITLYDSNYNGIYDEITNSSIGTRIIFRHVLNAGDYYLKINLLDSSEDYESTEISYSITYDAEHTHHPISYLRYTSTLHYCICSCGLSFDTSPHTVVRSEAMSGVGHCMHCDALIMLNDDIVQVPFSTQKVTINGSYILPSGIIVLADEDVEAYENGTLVFYDKDKLPQTQ